VRPGPGRAGAAGAMMSPDITMADAITALVEQKRAVGYKYAAEARVLARFAAFCHSEFPALAVPDQASVEAWLSAAQRRAVTPATLQGLAAPVRELARWLGRRGVPPYIDAAQPEPGDQQNDRVVPLPARITPVDRLQDPGHICGIPHRRNPDLFAGPPYRSTPGVGPGVAHRSV
jgi:hypothetical protein